MSSRMGRSGRIIGRVAIVAAAVVLDLLLLACAMAVVFVFVSGGGQFEIGRLPVSVTTSANPILFACAIIVLRIPLAARVGFFGLSRLNRSTLEPWAERAVAFLARPSVSRRLCAAALVGLVVVSTSLRGANVITSPGFFTGDDVEVQEMSIQKAIGVSWPVWNIRSALYPMVFIYPAQAVARTSGVGVDGLVIAGRLAVLLIATAALFLVFSITVRLSGSREIGLLALLLFATSRLHLWYGASELPRPVAAVFVLGAFQLLLGRGWRRSLAAGVFAGFAGSLRFGELVFFLPAVVQLALEKRRRDLFIVVVAGAATSAAALGLADWLYWGAPFFSLRNIVDYTLVKGLSSRGFQPAWQYFLRFGEWCNPAVMLLSLFGIARGDRRVSLWTWIPVLALSLLPHKEPRYLIAVEPFACIGAALALRPLASAIGASRPRLRRAAAVVLMVVLAGSVVFEVTSWRFPRSNDAVRLARRIAAERPHGVAAVQLWRFGGHLYWPAIPVIELGEVSERSVTDAVTDERIDWLVIPRRESSEAALRAASAHGLHEAGGFSTSSYVVLRRSGTSAAPAGRPVAGAQRDGTRLGREAAGRGLPAAS